MSHPPTVEQLEAIAGRLLPGGRLARARALPGGVSSQATALEVADEAGQVRTYVLRQPPSHAPAWREHRLLALLVARGLPVPTPRFLGEAGDILANDWLVLDYVEGATHYRREFGEARAEAMARVLHAIHAVDTSSGLFAFLPGGDDGATLLHGDFWPGNILWRGEALAGVIDWEDALLGDPLLDVAITRLDLALIHGIEASGRFTERYAAATERDMSPLPRFDRRAVERMRPYLEEWNGGWAALGRPDLSLDVIRARFATFIAHTLG